MKFATLTRALLLGMVLGASPVSAMEIAAPAERLGGNENTLRPPAAGDVSNSQQQRRVKKAKIKAGKGATDTEAALKKRRAAAERSTDGAGETASENASPAEPESIALRGVRG
jgi:hypothetical protein